MPLIKKAIIVCFFWSLITGIFYATPIYGQARSSDHERDKTHHQEYPEKRKNRKTWEQILSFPRMALVFPFKIVFKGISKILGFFYVPQKVGKLYDLMHSDNGLRYVIPMYTSRSGAGLKFYQKNLINEGSVLKLRATMGLNFRQKYELSFKDLKPFGGGRSHRFSLGLSIDG